MTRTKTNWKITKTILPVVTLLLVIGVVAGLGHLALAQVTYGPTDQYQYQYRQRPTPTQCTGT
ncbi:hypothetical protein [Vulcanisaeta souniana]|uniref:hypothetical protein n=1 Tax=Vulcanisaeta souniana TaxID=164452 RepID=UPI001FB4B28D|nr:hypothetical protein [Vulcanisaeta souniana]